MNALQKRELKSKAIAEFISWLRDSNRGNYVITNWNSAQQRLKEKFIRNEDLLAQYYEALAKEEQTKMK